MEGPRGCHIDIWSKSDTGEILYDIPYTVESKIIHMNFLTKQRLTDLENELMVVGGKG